MFYLCRTPKHLSVYYIFITSFQQINIINVTVRHYDLIHSHTVLHYYFDANKTFISQ